jgi:hypothetical protein
LFASSSREIFCGHPFRLVEHIGPSLNLFTAAFVWAANTDTRCIQRVLRHLFESVVAGIREASSRREFDWWLFLNHNNLGLTLYTLEQLKSNSGLFSEILWSLREHLIYFFILASDFLVAEAGTSYSVMWHLWRFDTCLGHRLAVAVLKGWYRKISWFILMGGGIRIFVRLN